MQTDSQAFDPTFFSIMCWAALSAWGRSLGCLSTGDIARDARFQIGARKSSAWAGSTQSGGRKQNPKLLAPRELSAGPACNREAEAIKYQRNVQSLFDVHDRKMIFRIWGNEIGNL